MGRVHFATWACWAVSVTCGACSEQASDPEQEALSLEVQGEGGLLTFTLESEQPVAEGAIDLTLTILRAGDRLDPVAVQATVLMPAMAHGASSPEPEQVAPGRFLLADVDLSMPGRYELEIVASTDQLEDWATITLDVP